MTPSKSEGNREASSENSEPTEFEKFEALAKGLLTFKKPVPETPPEPRKGPRKKHE